MTSRRCNRRRTSACIILKLHHPVVTLQHSTAKAACFHAFYYDHCHFIRSICCFVSGITAEALQQTILHLVELYLYVVRSTSKYLYCTKRCASGAVIMEQTSTLYRSRSVPADPTGWETPHVPCVHWTLNCTARQPHKQHAAPQVYVQLLIVHTDCLPLSELRHMIRPREVAERMVTLPDTVL